MTLLIEDGTGVDNANSYATTAEFNEFRKSRGDRSVLDISVSERALTSGTMFVDSFDERLLGQKVSPFQALAWPRKDITVSGEEFPDNEVPQCVKNACMEAALVSMSTDPLAASDGREITRERIEGVIDTTYSQSNGKSFKAPSVEALLKPFLRKSTLSVVRA